MKRIIIIISCLWLAGCAELGMKNPISNNTLGTAISTYGLLDSAVIAYRGLPRCTIANNFAITNVCYKRSVLVVAKNYDKTANDAINKAVAFQRSNPTLDASSYIDAAVAAVDTFKSFSQQNSLPGVN